MPFSFRKKRKADATSSTADIEQITISKQQENNENVQPNNSPLLMMRDEPKKKTLSKSSSYSFISWLTPRKKTQSTQSISNNNNNTSLTSIEDNSSHQTPKTPSTKSPRNSKLITSQSTSYIMDHVERQKSSNFSSSTMLQSLTPLNNHYDTQQLGRKRQVKSEKTPRTCSSPTSDDEYHLGIKHSFTMSVISDDKSPRFVLSAPDHAQELIFGSAVENIISDCDSDGFCFSPLVDETSPFQETANKTATNSILSDDQAEKEVDELELFEEWAKRFDTPEPSYLSTTQFSTKKKSASSSFSKLFNAVSHLDPFVHIHNTPSQKHKVKSLSPKSATTNDLFRNYNDTETGGALIINDEPAQDKGRFSKSFKNLMMGKKSPVNGALSSLSPRHDKSPPPHTVVQHSRLLVVLPDEIKSLIFEFAEFRDILSIRTVCKELNAITDDDRFWQRVCFELSLDFSTVTYKHLKSLFIENQIHITLVGDEGVGKSLLIRRFSNNPAHILESTSKGGRKQLYDSMYTQDEEPYYIYFKKNNKVDKSHKKSSRREDVYFVCFSILDKKSLSRTKKWIKAIRAKDITKPIILVGLKVDLRDEEGSDQFKLIKTEQGEQFKTRFKLFSYREVSNKTRTGLTELMCDAINAKRIQTEKFYNYDKTLGTEAEMEDISEDVFNYSDEDDMDLDGFNSALPTNTTTTSISKTATLSKRLSQMKIKDSFVLD